MGESVRKVVDFCLTLCVLTAKLEQFCLGLLSETIFLFIFTTIICSLGGQMDRHCELGPIYTCTCTHTHTCVCVCTYICMYVMYVCMSVYR
jgi:hypothetical protein